MEGNVPQGDHRLPELSAPIGFLWASNLFANGLLHELKDQVTACLALVECIEKSSLPGPAGDLTNQLEKSLQICATLITKSKRIIENNFYNSTNLNEVTDFLVRILRHVIHQDVQLDLCLDPAVDDLKVEIKGLETVLAALLIRAREALNGDGSIIVETRSTHLDAPRTTDMVRLPPGDYATLTITCSNDGDPDPKWEQWLSEGDDHSTGPPSSSFVRPLLTGMGAQIDVTRWPYLGAVLQLYFPTNFHLRSPSALETQHAKSGK